MKERLLARYVRATVSKPLLSVLFLVRAIEFQCFPTQGTVAKVRQTALPKTTTGSVCARQIRDPWAIYLRDFFHATTVMQS
jgi:hypothetical protein